MIPLIPRGKTGILFDLDGTLIYSSKCHKDAFLCAAAESGVTLDAGFYETVAGMTTESAAEVLGIAPERRSAFVDRKRSAYIERVVNGDVPEIPGATALLRTALDLGWQVALVTSASANSAHAIVDNMGWGSYFQTIVTGDDVIQGKPSPEPFLLAIEILGLGIDACIGVEDSEAGLAALSRANIVAIRVNHSTSLALTTSTLSEVLLALSSYETRADE